MMDVTPRVPPHSNEAEISVLGSILLDNESLDAENVAELRANMFYREGHRKIFTAMHGVLGKGEPVDLITLQNELNRLGQLDEVGGLTYLIGLSEQVPTAAYVGHYAAIVREKWTLREIISQSGRAMQAAYDQQRPLEEILAQAGRVGTDLEIHAHQGNYPISGIIDEIMLLMSEGHSEPPVPTGLSDLDAQLGGGLYRQTLNILAARPSMGKSALALNIAENVAGFLKDAGEAGQVVVVSLEMKRVQMVTRVIAGSGRIDSAAVKAVMAGNKRAMTERQYERFANAAARLNELPITFRDDPVIDENLHILATKLRKLSKETPLRLVVIDYLQLMNDGRPGKGGDNRQQEISNISRGLKKLARELDCAFLVLSQLSRAVEQRPNHRPMLSDLRESGAVEQDADVVMFIYRDEYYNKETDQQGIAEINVAKQRDGAVGVVKLQFHSVHVRFSNLAYT